MVIQNKNQTKKCPQKLRQEDVCLQTSWQDDGVVTKSDKKRNEQSCSQTKVERQCGLLISDQLIILVGSYFLLFKKKAGVTLPTN